MKIFVAILTVLIVLTALPAINELLTTMISDLVNTLPGMEGWELAYWGVFPIIICGYILIIVPFQMVAGGKLRGLITRGRGRGEDE